MNFNVYEYFEMVEEGCWGEPDRYRSSYFFTALTEDQIKQKMIEFCENGNEFNWFNLFHSLESEGIIVGYYDDGCVDLDVFGAVGQEIFVGNITAEDILSDDIISEIKRRKEEEERIKKEKEREELARRSEELRQREIQSMVSKLKDEGYEVIPNNA